MAKKYYSSIINADDSKISNLPTDVKIVNVGYPGGKDQGSYSDSMPELDAELRSDINKTNKYKSDEKY